MVGAAMAQAIVYRATYGKPVQTDGGPVVPGIEHALTSWSAGLPRDLAELLRPRILIPVDANPLRVVALDQHTKGALIVLPAFLNPRRPGNDTPAWCIAARMRPYNEDGEKAGGRPMTVITSWNVKAGDWSAASPGLIPELAAQLHARPDVAASIAGELRVQDTAIIPYGGVAPHLTIGTFSKIKGGLWRILEGILKGERTEWSGATFKTEADFLHAMALIHAILPGANGVSPRSLVSFSSGLALGREHFLVSYLERGEPTPDDRSVVASSSLLEKLDPNESFAALACELSAASDNSVTDTSQLLHYESASWRYFHGYLFDSLQERYFPKPRRMSILQQSRASKNASAARSAAMPQLVHAQVDQPRVSRQATVEQVERQTAPPALLAAAATLGGFRDSSANDVAPLQILDSLKYLRIRGQIENDAFWEGELIDVDQHEGPEVVQLLRLALAACTPGLLRSSGEFYPLRDIDTIMRLSKALRDLRDAEAEEIAGVMASQANDYLIGFFQQVGILDEHEIGFIGQLDYAMKASIEALRGQGQAARISPVRPWLVLAYFDRPSGGGGEMAVAPPYPSVVADALQTLIQRCRRVPLQPRVETAMLAGAIEFLARHDPAQLRRVEAEMPTVDGGPTLAAIRDILLRHWA